MEREALRESTGSLERRMKELGRSIDDVMIRSCGGMVFQFYAQGLMLGVSRWQSMTCNRVWMPLSVSQAIFAITSFVLYDNLQLLWRYSAEMEHVREELSENRRRLLELGMDHNVYLAKIAAIGTWVDPPTRLAYQVLFFFVVMSVGVMYGIYTGGCDR